MTLAHQINIMINKESKNHETLDLPSKTVSLTQSKNLLETPPSAVHLYYPNGRSTAYYCYSYREGSRVKHIHIKGGQIGNKRAVSNAEEVRRAIALGKSPPEIRKLIQSQI